jgi:hypothetical protein
VGLYAILSLAATSTSTTFSHDRLQYILRRKLQDDVHSNAEQEEPTTGLTTPDSEFDVEEGIEGTETHFLVALLCHDWIILQLLGRVRRICLK